MMPAMVISTYPDRLSASRAARQLVSEGAAACVNISEITSVYRWKGSVEDHLEYLAAFKTVQRNLSLLKRRIQETHPYDIPEIAEIGISSINMPYLAWLGDPNA